MSILFFAVMAFLTSLALLGVGRGVALRFGFADCPGGRKTHDQPVPPIGGLVILPVFAAVCLMLGLHETVPIPLIIGLGILLIMGAIDDKKPIQPALKFAIMVLTCCYVVIFGEGQIQTLGNLFGFGVVNLGVMDTAFTVMALVLFMNAINMMDGLDGLAGGFCALVVLWLMAAAYGAGMDATFGALAILCAVLLAFLMFNARHPFRKKASVFLGDSGALSLGLLIGWFCIQSTQMQSAPLSPAVIIWLIALPVMDAFGLFIARSLMGQNPFSADRRHLHHRLINAGLSVDVVVILMLGFFVATAMIGLVAQIVGLSPALLFWVWLGVFMAHTYGIIRPNIFAPLASLSKMCIRQS